MDTARQKYEALISRHLGRAPLTEDGFGDEEISAPQVHDRLPAALREYYRVAGHLDTLNRAHNILLDPAELVIEDGYLIFMEENQSVVSWGIPASALGETDPMVWQRVNSSPVEWYSEELVFSEFLIRMFDWQAGLGEAH